MKKISIIVLVTCGLLTVLALAGWVAGFVFASSFGSLIHLLLLFAIVTGFGAIVGGILLIVSLIQKK